MQEVARFRPGGSAMKILTGTFRNGVIVFDSPPGLPDETRVRVVVEATDPQFDERTPVVQSEEEVRLVQAGRKRIGRITREECG